MKGPADGKERREQADQDKTTSCHPSLCPLTVAAGPPLPLSEAQRHTQQADTQAHATHIPRERKPPLARV